MAEFVVLEENLRAMLRAFVRANASGEGHDLPGVSVASSGIQFAMFNAALLSSPVAGAAELEDRVRAAGQFFRTRGLPWSFWLCEDWLKAHARREANRVFWSQGLHLVVDLPGMAAERVRPAARPLPALEYRRVEDSLTRYAFNYIMSVTFGIPLATCSQVYESERMWGDGLAGYLGYLDGSPVTTTVTLAAGGAIGIYAVATLPAYQRKGYAESVLRHALAAAREETGLERTVLESSRAGFTLYDRMGYETVTRYTVYAFS